MARYRISTPRFIRQRGQQEPVYVAASPGAPVEVDMDDVEPDGTPFKPGRGMTPVDAPLPELKLAFVDRKAQVPRATEASRKGGGGRAADT